MDYDFLKSGKTSEELASPGFYWVLYDGHPASILRVDAGAGTVVPMVVVSMEVSFPASSLKEAVWFGPIPGPDDIPSPPTSPTSVATLVAPSHMTIQ